MSEQASDRAADVDSASAPFGVVLNYFSTRDVPHLRASLLFAAALSIQDALVREVIVVDGSGHADEELRRDVERLGARYHHDGRTLSFAEGYNVGAAMVTAPWLVLSASDIYPALELYSAAQALIERPGPRIGCIIPRLTNADLPIQESDWRGRAVCAVPLMTLNLNIFSRATFLEMGGVPERYSGAFNDVEMALRLRDHGLPILMLPVRCHHYGSLTLASAASNYRFLKDREVFYAHYPHLAQPGSFWDLAIAKFFPGMFGLVLRLVGALAPARRRLGVQRRVLRLFPLLGRL